MDTLTAEKFHQLRYCSLVQMYRLYQALIFARFTTAKRSQAREIRHCHIDVGAINFPAHGFSEQFFEVVRPAEGIDLDLAHSIEVMSDAIDALVILPAHRFSSSPIPVAACQV